MFFATEKGTMTELTLIFLWNFKKIWSMTEKTACYMPCLLAVGLFAPCRVFTPSLFKRKMPAAETCF